MIRQLTGNVVIGSMPEATQRALLGLLLPIVLVTGVLLLGSSWLRASIASGWLLAELLALLAVGAAWLLRHNAPVWLMQSTMLLFVALAMWSGVAADGSDAAVIVTGAMAMLMVGLSGGRLMLCAAMFLAAGSWLGAQWQFPGVAFSVVTPLLICVVLLVWVIVAQLQGRVRAQYAAWQQAGFLLNSRERSLADFRRGNDGFRRMLEREAQQKSLQLQRANRELREANAHLESFNYTVSHDIRASLRILDGLAKVLVEELQENRPAAAQQIAVRMQNSIMHMHGMVKELLRMSTANNLPIRRREVDLSAMARELVRDLKTAEPQRRVSVAIADNIHACAQPDLIREVLQNLLFNAWKFTAQRSDAFIAMNVSNDADGSKVYYVSDNGVGFDMSRATELFQPFRRLHGEQEYEGTGVGLAAVKRIIERHGGRVWALAEPGRGARLCFTLGERTSRQRDPVTNCGQVTRSG